MTKTLPIRLLTMTLLLAIPLILFTCGSNDNVIYSARAATPAGIDTVPKKQYQYFLTVKRMEYADWNMAVDTLSKIHALIGKSMTKDQSDYYQALADQQLIKIARKFARDSAEVKTKP